MTEIETKRKELFKYYKYSYIGNEIIDGWIDNFNNRINQIINSSVEMARKEFHISECPICTHKIMEARREERKEAQKEFLDVLKRHCNEIILAYHKNGIDIEYQIKGLFEGVKQSLEGGKTE